MAYEIFKCTLDIGCITVQNPAYTFCKYIIKEQDKRVYIKCRKKKVIIIIINRNYEPSWRPLAMGILNDWNLFGKKAKTKKQDILALS